MTEVWTKWESLVINGAFPLRRFLGKSNHSVVFLTEFKARDLLDAAIKLVPADPVRAEAQLACWRMVASISHPHLIRLFESGRCQIAGQEFLFVVMEYADQTLDQLLAHRALTPDEVREMLPATLDALAFLHRKRLVQGQLKPPNFLVVNDQLKLAGDTARPAGASRVSIAKASLYDPPEATDGRIFGAGDVWALGITIVEALTQHSPAWPDEKSEAASLPPTIPPDFVDTVARCLSRNPANRPTITDLQAQFKPPAEAPAAPVAQPVVQEVAEGPPPAEKSPATLSPVPAIAVVGLVMLAAIWVGMRLFQSHPASKQPDPGPSYSSSLPAAASPAPAARSAAPPIPKLSAPAPPTVLHQEIPDVPRSVRASIRGHIIVTIRVIVDRSGAVVHETVVFPGTSRYFARLAAEAAGKWSFSPADTQESRAWLLRFEFTRTGTTGNAAISRP
jgi:serine/threonine protein kinase